MNIKVICHLTGLILVLEAVFMVPAVLISLYDGEIAAVQSLLLTITAMAAVSAVLLYTARTRKRSFYAQEGFVTVGLSWIVMSVFGCLPFVISGEIPSFVDALFEVVSGFTTTGASILPDVEAISRGLLYWRSFTHWLGGMGMLVFLLAVIPQGPGAGYSMHLLRAESPGPSVGKLTPRLGETAKALYLIYIALTVSCCVFLLLGGMPLFDSVCTAFGTAGTGGFGIKGDSLAGYSPYLQNVVTVFMALFGVNFSIYYLLLLREFKIALLDEELRLYFGLMLGSIALISWNTVPLFGSLREAIHHSAFQVSSIMTTSGFSTVDFNVWPPFSKAILLGLMFVGASAGSTGGGIKCARILLLMKELRRNIRKTMHPRAVRLVRINNRGIDEQVIQNVNAYMAAYLVLAGLSFILVSLDGFSFETNFSAVAACFNNIGPGFDAAGPMANYSGYSIPSKLILTADMLLGRLEIFPILTLFSRHTWDRSK